MKNKSMPPKEAAARMLEIAQGDDTEYDHANADDLLCDLLRDTYSEAVKIFEEMEKWYA